MKTKPFKFQTLGVKVILDAFKRSYGFMLGDEMGLGKSLQALMVADKIKKKYKRILIVCPAGLVEKWQDEIKKHLTKNRSYSITVQSYNELTKAQTLFFITRHRYDLTICDEAHYIKDFESLRTRAVLGAPGDRHRTIVSVSDKMLGLSGTWPPNRVGELYPWLYRTQHPLTVNLTYEKFLYQYAEKVWEGPHGTQHKGVKNIKKLQILLSANFLARSIDEVSSDIPPGTVVNVPVEFSIKDFEQEKELLLKLLSAAGHSPSEYNLIFNTPDFLQNLMSLVPGFVELSEYRKRQGLLKVKTVFEYLKESVLPECKKFILFCYHKEAAENYYSLLSPVLKKADTLCEVVHGGNSDKETRFKQLKQLDKADRAVLIATIDSVKEGFDLTGFTRSFFAEYDWRLYAIEQAQGRTRRTGQKKPVFWTFFTLDKGVENLMYQRVSEKTKDISKIKAAGKR